jgi:type IV secretory pathway TraG/TraD family ATPase VirD4
MSVEAGGRLFVGTVAGGLALGEPQQSALVLGPPRSGKTSSLAIPNVLFAPGPVVVTSTKPDVLAATIAERSKLGQCWLFDPTGALAVLPGVKLIRWSPVAAARTWDESLVLARSMSGAARPAGRRGEAAHWTERAEALLAPLLHASYLRASGIEAVLGWVLRQDLDEPSSVLSLNGVRLGCDVLAGLGATDPREMSGIWSSAAGLLAAYRSEQVLDRSGPVNFDPFELAGTTDTVYVCAPARHQDLVAPVVVALLDQARAGSYTSWRAGVAPLTMVLDELANIAPIPDLPALLSEGGSQGVLTFACLQDLSQARLRWGDAADGLLSLFGAKVVLPGIADMTTLELVSRLGGEVDVPSKSVTRSPFWSPTRGAPSVTWSNQRQRRLPVDAVSQQPRGTALLISGSQPTQRVRLAPWWEIDVLQKAPTRDVGRSRSLGG